MAELRPVTVLVADDEPVARAGLRALLAWHDWLRCIGEAGSGPATVEAAERLRPELLFLDIAMPGLSGLEVLQRLQHRPHVVFTTAHAEHAVTAFELGALDYLLKPFGPERLRATLERVRAALGEPLAPAVDRLAEALGQGPLSRLFVRSGRSILPLAIEAVGWIEAVGDYVAVHHDGTPEPHLLHLALSRLEERLDPARFVRIHRTCIVNLDRVAAFRRQLDGTLVAELLDGTRLPVSRSRARQLRELAR